MAVCCVILRGQQIYTVIQAVHSLLYIVAKCHFFSVVTWKDILKYLQKCEGCTHFCEILYILNYCWHWSRPIKPQVLVSVAERFATLCPTEHNYDLFVTVPVCAGKQGEVQWKISELLQPDVTWPLPRGHLRRRVRHEMAHARGRDLHSLIRGDLKVWGENKPEFK